MSRTTVRLNVGRSGANSELGTPEVGLEKPGLSLSHLEDPGLPTQEEKVMYFQTLAPTVRPVHGSILGVAVTTHHLVLLLSEFSPRLHLPAIKERQFLSGYVKTECPRA